jgi:hypothetical protein
MNTTMAKAGPRQPASVELVAAMLWDFRLELALLVVAGGAYAGLFLAGHLTPVAAGVMVGTVAVVLLLVGRTRRALGRSLHAARVRRSWRLAWMHCALAPVKPGKVARVPAGERIEVRLSRGSSFEELSDRAEQLACCLSLRELRVVRDPGDASRGTVTLVRRDPLAGLARMPWPRLIPAETSLWEAIPVGVDEHGGTVEVSLVERSLLAGGEPGAGKSAAMSMLIATAALDSTAKLWLLDGKLVELAPWASCAEVLVGPDVGEAIDLLEQVREEMERRYRQLLMGGLRKIDRDAGMSLHVVACDELAFYLSCEDRKQRTRFAELLRDLVARGRAAGVIVLAATQKLRRMWCLRRCGICSGSGWRCGARPRKRRTRSSGRDGRAKGTAPARSPRPTGASDCCSRRTGCRSSCAPSTSTTSRSVSWRRALARNATGRR